MNVHVEVRPHPAAPQPDGAHALAWSYVLDRVFAAASAARVARLDVIVPGERLAAMTELRAELTPDEPGVGRAVAHLVPGAARSSDADRAFTLDFGWRAPRPAPDGWRLDEELFVYTRRAQLYGALMRAARATGDAALVDRAWLGVRQNFVSTAPVSAYYRLAAWERT